MRHPGKRDVATRELIRTSQRRGRGRCVHYHIHAVFIRRVGRAALAAARRSRARASTGWTGNCHTITRYARWSNRRQATRMRGAGSRRWWGTRGRHGSDGGGERNRRRSSGGGGRTAAEASERAAKDERDGRCGSAQQWAVRSRITVVRQIMDFNGRSCVSHKQPIGPRMAAGPALVRQIGTLRIAREAVLAVADACRLRAGVTTACGSNRGPPVGAPLNVRKYSRDAP